MVNLDTMNALSLDIGGTHIACAVVAGKKVLAQESISSGGAQALEALMPQLQSTLEDLLRKAGLTSRECAGLALGFPGVVDFRTGAIHATFKKYEDAPRIDLAGWSQRAFGLPMRIESDARMALLGEWYAGAGEGYDDIVMLTLGTGIGGAAMMHGRLIRGKHALAGSMGGHFPVEIDGRICVCGNPGCAEAEAAGWSMPLVARSWPGFAESSLAALQEIGFRDLFEHAQHGDRVAAAVRERCLHVWGANAIANFNAYEPDVIIVGGGVMQSAGRILPSLTQYIDRYVFAPSGKPGILAAKLGNDAGLLGAIPLLSEVIDDSAV